MWYLTRHPHCMFTFKKTAKVSGAYKTVAKIMIVFILQAHTDKAAKEERFWSQQQNKFPEFIWPAF